MPSNEGAINGVSPYKVLVVGGSYAGLAATLNLLDLSNGKAPRFSEPTAENTPTTKLPVDITIVDERDGYYHLIGNPLAFASEKAAQKSWVRFQDIPALKVPNIRTIQGSVTNVDPEKKVASIVDTESQGQRQERYDYLVVGSGLRRAFPVVPQSLTREDYLSEATSHIKAIQKAEEGVVVIGGGAVGIEMASEIKIMEPQIKVTLIHSRDKLLSAEPLPDDFKDRTLQAVKDSGVEVVLNQRVTSTTTVDSNSSSSPLWNLTLANGTHIKASHIITAISRITPTTSYLPPSALDKNGYVRIEPSLHFQPTISNPRHHFAIGDLVSWSGIKRCGAAMHQGHYAAVNIHQDILAERTGSTPKYFELGEIPPMIGLAVGKQAICYTPSAGTYGGEEHMPTMFGDDLGWSICWNYMKLGVSPDA